MPGGSISRSTSTMSWRRVSSAASAASGVATCSISEPRSSARTGAWRASSAETASTLSAGHAASCPGGSSAVSSQYAVKTFISRTSARNVTGLTMYVFAPAS